jgi:hypothetical protein
MNTNNYFVYIYTDPSRPQNIQCGDIIFQHEPFYVGLGKHNRHLSHLLLKNRKRDGNKHKVHKIEKLLAMGYDLTQFIVMAAQGITKQEAIHLEKLFIAQLGRRSNGTGCLVNLTEGGEGTVGFPITDAFREKISKIHKGRKASPETKEKLKLSKLGDKNPSFGKLPSDEQRLKQHLATKGKINIKSISLIDPDGNKHETLQGVTLFCEIHGLSQRNVSAMFRGIRKTCKGWTVDTAERNMEYEEFEI